MCSLASHCTAYMRSYKKQFDICKQSFLRGTTDKLRPSAVRSRANAVLLQVLLTRSFEFYFVFFVSEVVFVFSFRICFPKRHLASNLFYVLSLFLFSWCFCVTSFPVNITGWFSSNLAYVYLCLVWSSFMFFWFGRILFSSKVISILLRFASLFLTLLLAMFGLVLPFTSPCSYLITFSQLFLTFHLAELHCLYLCFHFTSLPLN